MKPSLDEQIGFRTETKTKEGCLKFKKEMNLGYNDLIKISLRLLNTEEGKEQIELEKLNKKIEDLKNELEKTIHEKESLMLRISQRKEMENNIIINGKIQEAFEEILDEFNEYSEIHNGDLDFKLNQFEDFRNGMFVQCSEEFKEFGGNTKLVFKYWKDWIQKQQKF